MCRDLCLCKGRKMLHVGYVYTCAESCIFVPKKKKQVLARTHQKHFNIAVSFKAKQCRKLQHVCIFPRRFTQKQLNEAKTHSKASFTWVYLSIYSLSFPTWYALIFCVSANRQSYLCLLGCSCWSQSLSHASACSQM